MTGCFFPPEPDLSIFPWIQMRAIVFPLAQKFASGLIVFVAEPEHYANTDARVVLD